MSDAKLVQVQDLDETTGWLTIPGDTADFNENKDAESDTIFGASYESNQPTLATWDVSSNVRYRGFAGYRSVLRRMGTPTAFTSEAMEQENGNTYIITDQSSAPWNWEADLTIEDDGVEVDDDDIVEIDPLFGRVTFADSYTVSGAITVSGEYFPLEPFGNANGFDLTQSCDTTSTTSFEVAQDNGGYVTLRPTLRDASLSLTAFYRSDDGFTEPMRDEEQFIVEIDPAGNGESLARGIYRIESKGNSGDVGGDEETSVELTLSVPEGFVPFSWWHDDESNIPAALKLLLDKYTARENVLVRYLPEGVGNPGHQGEVVITDVSLSSEVDGLVEGDFNGEGTGPVQDIFTT